MGDTPSGLSKESPTSLTPKEFLDREETLHTIALRERAATFLFISYSLLLFSTMAIFFLQGFNAWNFNLDLEILRWLGGATIGEVGGLAALVYGALFRKK